MQHRPASVLTTLALSLLLIACQDDNDDAGTASDMPDTSDTADTPPATEGESAGIANPLVDSASLDALANEFLSSNPVAGMSIAVVRTDGEPLVWSGNYGVRDIDTGAPVNDETSFWLGSVSKMVMGTAMMIAREKGFLDLNDEVQALLSTNGSFPIDNPSQQPITLAHLASHTSGIVDAQSYVCAYFMTGVDGEPSRDFVDPDGDPLVDTNCPEQTPVSLEGFLGSYLSQAGTLYDIDENFSDAAPGEEEDYSNIGAGLAGHVIGLSTGQDLATFAAQEIFAPLSMQHTSWRSADLEPANIATPYLALEDGLFALPKYELSTWPDGGLRSNAADLAALLSAFMQDRRSDGSSMTLLSAESIEMMLPVEDAAYGLFVEGDFEPFAGEGSRILGHSGSDPGAFSLFLFDPATHIGVVLTANGDDDEVDEDALEALVSALFDAGTALQATSD